VLERHARRTMTLRGRPCVLRRTAVVFSIAALMAGCAVPGYDGGDPTTSGMIQDQGGFSDDASSNGSNSPQSGGGGPAPTQNFDPGTADGFDAGGSTGSVMEDAGSTSGSNGGNHMVDSGDHDSGSGIDSAVDSSVVISANDPLGSSARCTSGKTWTSGTGQTMRPGEACPSCHGNFVIAGTVYPTGHEPNDCDGVNGSTTTVTVVVTDSTNKQFTLTPNAVGNFYSSTKITPPITAKVVENGKERAMVSPQTITNCNMCHTSNGANGAPGRITLPI
jgi:hypothetical protein